MPVPVKPMIEPEFLSRAYPAWSAIPLQNPSYSLFLDRLHEAGIDCLDVSQALAQRKRSTGHSQFLRTDTHWTPEAMEASAALLAEKIGGMEAVQEGPQGDFSESTRVLAGVGDIAAMLKLPASSRLYPKENVTIRPVSQANGEAWSADHRADILVLGDSFANMFSLPGMGWGSRPVWSNG